MARFSCTSSTATSTSDGGEVARRRDDLPHRLAVLGPHVAPERDLGSVSRGVSSFVSFILDGPIPATSAQPADRVLEDDADHGVVIEPPCCAAAMNPESGEMHGFAFISRMYGFPFGSTRKSTRA